MLPAAAAAASRSIHDRIGGNDPDPVFIRKKVYSRRFAAQIDSMSHHMWSAGSMIADQHHSSHQLPSS